MSLKQIAKQVLPPVVVDVAKALVKRSGCGFREWEYVPGGWGNNTSRVRGWNVESVLQTQQAKWPQFLELAQANTPLGIAHEATVATNDDYATHNTIMSFAYVLALASRKKERISMLDWGGGLGHYYVISKALLPEVEIDYHCRDLPRLCQGGREVLPEATFHEADDCLERSYDVVVASSSLQYCEDWRRLASQLASVSRPYLFVTRLPIVHRAASFVVLQRPCRNEYQTEYLGWFLNREEFLGYIASLNMGLVREFLIQEQPNVYSAPEQGESRGFLFCRKEEKTHL